MTTNEIKTAVAHLPHVTKVWIKGQEVFIHPVKGATKVDLSEQKLEQEVAAEAEEVSAEQPVKPSKKKKDGSQ